MTVLIGTEIFLRLAFGEPGWDHCGALLGSMYFGVERGVMRSLPVSELFTPFEGSKDEEGRDRVAVELKKLRFRVRGPRPPCNLRGDGSEKGLLGGRQAVGVGVPVR